MKKLILLTISVILFNSCEKQEDNLADELAEENDEFAEENSKAQHINKKSTSLFGEYYYNKDFVIAGDADYNRDGHMDAWFIKIANTRTGYIEIHVLDGKNNHSSLLFSRASILRTTVTRDYTFRVGDYNRDRRIDLWAVRRRGAGTKRLEVHIIDGATNFSSWMINRITQRPELNNVEFIGLLTDYNNDGWLDLSIYDYSEAWSKIYFDVLDGRVKFTSYLARRVRVYGARQ